MTNKTRAVPANVDHIDPSTIVDVCNNKGVEHRAIVDMAARHRGMCLINKKYRVEIIITKPKNCATRAVKLFKPNKLVVIHIGSSCPGG